MPGKNSQDWIDDAAFWDEAWADMEQRLEEKPSRKGVFIWTRWIVLLTLLLGGLVAARVISNQETPKPSASVTTEVIVESRTPPTLTPAEQNLPEANQKTTAPLVSKARLKADTKASLSTSSPQEIQAYSPAILKPAVTLRTSQAADKSLAQEVPPGNQAIPNTPSNEVAQANAVEKVNLNPALIESALITDDGLRAQQTIQPLSWSEATITYDNQLTETTIVAQQQQLPLFIESGATLAQGRQTPGFYVGVATELSSKGRTSFPITLRYRKDQLRLGKSSGGGTQDEFAAGSPLLDQVTNAVEALQLASGTQATELTTSGIELSGGIQYRFSPKLSLGMTIGGEYLLSANGVVDAFRDGDMLTYTFNSRVSEDFDPSGFSNNVTANALTSSGVSSGSGINRFRLRSGLQLRYQITPRFDVTAGATRAMTPTYRSDLLRVRPTQFQLGVRYLLR